ncbi:MAG: FKBP-type peptidyl-prolyl cis-trans isomerase [Bacteroidales bacterium]|nr:FKBP-type peptidyl-prolyl cis-trans isomerase [Bacteroidales bacterium]
MMYRFDKPAIVLIVCAALIQGCAKNGALGLNDLNKKEFDAWAHVTRAEYPEYLWQETRFGSIVLYDQVGTGTLEPSDSTPYLRVHHTLRLLDGTVTATTDSSLSKQIGTYSPRYYYGPTFWNRGATAFYAGYREIIEGCAAADGTPALAPMKTGGSRTAVIPGWLQTEKKFDSRIQYLSTVTGTNEIVTVTLIEQIKDIVAWEIDSLSRFLTLHTDINPGDTTSEFRPSNYGFYYKQTKAPDVDTAFVADDITYVHYVGRLLDGTVFDTNIADTAKAYGLFDFETEVESNYKAMKITYGKTEDEMKSGDSSSSLITGFSRALFNMKAHEEGVAIFYSALGYGATGSASAGIGPYTPLIFEIRLTDSAD